MCSPVYVQKQITMGYNKEDVLGCTTKKIVHPPKYLEYLRRCTNVLGVLHLCITHMRMHTHTHMRTHIRFSKRWYI